jgi:hypothetical protein
LPGGYLDFDDIRSVDCGPSDDGRPPKVRNCVTPVSVSIRSETPCALRLPASRHHHEQEDQLPFPTVVSKH